MVKHAQREKPVARTRTPFRARTIVVLGAIGVVLVVGVATWYFLHQSTPVSLAAEHNGGPRLRVDRELIDFGPVKFGQMVNARFRLRNIGDQPLRLVVDPRVEAIEGC